MTEKPKPGSPKYREKAEAAARELHSGYFDERVAAPQRSRARYIEKNREKWEKLADEIFAQGKGEVHSKFPLGFPGAKNIMGSVATGGRTSQLFVKGVRLPDSESPSSTVAERKPWEHLLKRTSKSTEILLLLQPFAAQVPRGNMREPKYYGNDGKRHWSCRALDGLSDLEGAAAAADNYSYVVYYANAVSPPHEPRSGNTIAMVVLAPNALAKALYDEATKEPLVAEITFQKLFPNVTGSDLDTRVARFKAKYLKAIEEKEFARLSCEKCREIIFDCPEVEAPSGKVKCKNCGKENKAADASRYCKATEPRRITFPEPVGEADTPQV